MISYCHLPTFLIFVGYDPDSLMAGLRRNKLLPLQGRSEPNFENNRLYRSEELMNDGGYKVMKLRSTHSTPDYTVSAWMFLDAISNCPKNPEYLIHLFRSIYIYIYVCVCVCVCVCLFALRVLTLYNDVIYLISKYRFSCQLNGESSVNF